MGQKVNPNGLRLGIIKGWESNWYGGKDYSNKLLEDEKIAKLVQSYCPVLNIPSSLSNEEEVEEEATTTTTTTNNKANQQQHQNFLPESLIIGTLDDENVPFWRRNSRDNLS